MQNYKITENIKAIDKAIYVLEDSVHFDCTPEVNEALDILRKALYKLESQVVYEETKKALKKLED